MEFCPVCTLRKALTDGIESGESSFEEIGQAHIGTGYATI